MEDQPKNLVLAIFASLAILLGFHYLYEVPRRQAAIEAQRAAQEAAQLASPEAPAVAQPANPQTSATPPLYTDRAAALKQSPRVAIETPLLKGSIALRGGRLDDLVLLQYRQTVDADSPPIILLNPPGLADSYYTDFGWLAPSAAGVAPDILLPDADTLWEAEGGPLTREGKVTLRWDNGAGLRFFRVFQIDDGYLFSVEQRVENYGGAPVTLTPFARIARHGTPSTQGFYILHEGLIGVFNGTLEEVDYQDLKEESDNRHTLSYDSSGGWLGFTDKYWLVSLVPAQNETIKGRFSYRPVAGADYYQTDFLGTAQTLASGAIITSAQKVFAGAKEVRRLDAYQDSYGIPLFDRAVDFGLFYFLTKPIFYLLDYLFLLFGNFGIAILVLTVIIKALLFPLANKSYRAMSKMKILAPEMTRLRDTYKEDRVRLQQEMMALYRREKVNPAAGCLPILVQIPIFFALYKVLFVTIEMRHAPFFGWIQDLSAPDPTSVLNLFGLLPYDVPQMALLNLVSIGIWPLIMGATMYFQQKLNPPPPDPVQARIFSLLPFVFTFMLAHFAAGLVIYWAWNNFLSIVQQRLIMWRMGVKP